MLGQKHPHLVVRHVPWNSSKFESLRNLLKPSRARGLLEMFREDTASLVVAVQGNIEHSSLSLKACRIAKIKCLSYIPVPHSNHVMGAKLGACRDVFSSPIFKWPDVYVTISEEMERLLRERGAVAPVQIVYNGIDIDRFEGGDKEGARRDLKLPLDKILLGLVGRIEFRQKQQHLLVDAVSADPELKDKCHLVFAGEGPDSENLANLLNEKGVSHTIFEWCDTAPLYKALDALVIPSRYEGLPLVMLESLSSETTVFGSDRDGMRDILPESRRFRADDTFALSEALRAWIQVGCPKPEEYLVQRVRKEMSLEQFGRSFTEAILSEFKK
ncbi:glycosyltransferase [Rubritalea marina]|uniref:glycosyltransferase n=1 Tax=Rubritalea marina TaxID=361055 RepID=UPI001F0A2F1B|nr:glycosyltransferase [Rubritalea marina]